MAVKPGIEVLLERDLEPIKGMRVGVLTNSTAVTADLKSLTEILAADKRVNLTAIYTLDHGLSGMVETGGDSFGLYRDTGIPVYNIARFTPTRQMVRGLDVILYDTMDGGARYFANIYNMAKLMRAAAAAGIPFIVLDRPNPVNGVTVEGNVIESGYLSHIGMFPIAMRHGMTNGEIAQLFNVHFGIGADLTVVKMEGWDRGMWWDDTGLPWINPAPNLPTLQSVVLYPGICFFEGVNISLGRGTTRPFEFLGAPWIDDSEFADRLNALRLPGVQFRPVQFTPNFSNSSHPSYLETCKGVQVHVLDRDALRSTRVALSIIDTARRLYPKNAGWYFMPESGANYFELLTGTDKVRKALEAGVAVESIADGWAVDEARFAELRRPYLLY